MECAGARDRERSRGTRHRLAGSRWSVPGDGAPGQTGPRGEDGRRQLAARDAGQGQWIAWNGWRLIGDAGTGRAIGGGRQRGRTRGRRERCREGWGRRLGRNGYPGTGSRPRPVERGATGGHEGPAGSGDQGDGNRRPRGAGSARYRSSRGRKDRCRRSGHRPGSGWRCRRGGRLRPGDRAADRGYRPHRCRWHRACGAYRPDFAARRGDDGCSSVGGIHEQHEPARHRTGPRHARCCVAIRVCFARYVGLGRVHRSSVRYCADGQDGKDLEDRGGGSRRKIGQDREGGKGRKGREDRKGGEG